MSAARMHRLALAALCCVAVVAAARARAQVPTPVPENERGRLDAERSGQHDAANIRTLFWNFGMVGDYPPDPGNVDLSVFHSVEVPKGGGMNYGDGITPFVLAKIRQRSGLESYIMETGFRERQGISPYFNRVMRFEPRPGYFEPDPARNPGRSPAISTDPRTWPASWPDRRQDPDDPGWPGSWNGYFGKRAAADQESYTVMDDQFYDAWDFYPDARDSTRRGLGLRIEVRGFQWANPQASNVIFWHYDITNEGTTDYNDNIIFGLYMDSGVGGSALSCDNIFESDDDNAFFNRTFDQDVLNLVYTWDNGGHGRDLSGNCGRTGYLGYAYLETPGNSTNSRDDDLDGVTDERRDGGPGQQITGQDAIRANVQSQYNLSRFEATYGALENLVAYRAGVWWTGDEDMDWNPEVHDTGADGVPETGDTGELDGIPTAGEASFDRTDLNESDQIGLTGFKFNRIRPGYGNPDDETDGILFYTDAQNWPQRLYEKFTDPDSTVRFDPPLASNYNLGFVFASGPFRLAAGQTERFSLALAYGGDLNELRRTVRTVQQIYDANYQFAVPPKLPTLSAEAGDGYVQLAWDDVAERSADPVTGIVDFEGYRIYRSTDPEFTDPRVISTGTGSGPIGNGRPIAQFDLIDGIHGFSNQVVEGVAYYLGNDSGIRHTFRDTSVVNGQRYFYAVTAYDFGSESPSFYPSENAITVSTTLRGGTILPQNVVEVRPEPKVRGFERATTEAPVQVEGRGVGTVAVEVLASGAVPPDERLFKIAFRGDPDSVRATHYALIDSTKETVVFAAGRDLRGERTGPVAGHFDAGDGHDRRCTHRLPRRESDQCPAQRRIRGVPADHGQASGFPGGSDARVLERRARHLGLRRPGLGQAGQVPHRRAHASRGPAALVPFPRPRCRRHAQPQRRVHRLRHVSSRGTRTATADVAFPARVRDDRLGDVAAARSGRRVRSRSAPAVRRRRRLRVPNPRRVRRPHARGRGPAATVRGSESVRRLGELRAGALRELRAWRASHRVP